MVTPGAKKELVKEESEGRLRIQVRERAERNLANTRVRELVAQHYHVSIGAVRMISGHHSHSKMFSIDSSNK